MAMRKTSLYLPEELVVRLRRIAEAEGRSQAEVLRDAIVRYPAPAPKRHFRLARSGKALGRSVAGIPEEELLKGFGDESRSQ
jgi:hypothetical protein